MIRKVLALLRASNEDCTNESDVVEDTETCEDLLEFEEGDWVIIEIHEGQALAPPEVDPLENLLIEHPSMSVYQLRCQRSQEDVRSDEEEDEDSPRPVTVRCPVPWRATAWGRTLDRDNHIHTVQRARAHAERRKLTRATLCRQNLVKTCPSVKRYGYFKQPCRRLYNY